MKSTIIAIIIALAAISASAQAPDDVLATAKGHTFTTADLSSDTRSAFSNLPVAVGKARTALLAQMVDDELIAAEAKSRRTTAEKLEARMRAKAPDPSEDEVAKLYQANLAGFDGKPLEKVRDILVKYLRRGTEQTEMQKFLDSIRPKYKIGTGKDVNAASLNPLEMLVRVNGRPISSQEFENKNNLAIYGVRAEVSDLVLEKLNEIIYSALVIDEAKSLDVDAGSLIAREVSGKISPALNLDDAEDAFKHSLFRKYDVKVLFKEPDAVSQVISVDDDPARGPLNAPVTVIMFSDFQCPACSKTHPILKKVLAEYPEKIRFVVRDFPLVSIHEHAFRAALAAGAANAQGKFFEYTDILYTHQSALDDDSLKKYAADLGLDVKKFAIDLDAPKTADEVRKDMADGARYGINGTPTIYINGVSVRNLSADGFRRAIDRILKK